jgi:hypothetical protein
LALGCAGAHRDRPLAAVTVALAACSSSEAPHDQTPPLTFAQAIEPLLQDKCQQCHSEGGVAPFSLVTYEQVTGMAAAARQKVLAREMPPWGAFDDETCEMRHPIKDDLRLTDEQIDMFVRWVDDGMPLGDTSRRPAPRTFSAPVLEGRTHTFAMTQPFEVTATGKDDIRCFPVDPGFDVDTWIGGTNVVPGDPSVVPPLHLHLRQHHRQPARPPGDGGAAPLVATRDPPRREHPRRDVPRDPARGATGDGPRLTAPRPMTQRVRPPRRARPLDEPRAVDYGALDFQAVVVTARSKERRRDHRSSEGDQDPRVPHRHDARGRP